VRGHDAPDVGAVQFNGFGRTHDGSPAEYGMSRYSRGARSALRPVKGWRASISARTARSTAPPQGHHLSAPWLR
jgi:hypothetical protein